jgi:hypothetical protein
MCAPRTMPGDVLVGVDPDPSESMGVALEDLRQQLRGRAELEQRVVQQHQLAVGGQAAIRFEGVDMLLE